MPLAETALWLDTDTGSYDSSTENHSYPSQTQTQEPDTASTLRCSFPNISVFSEINDWLSSWLTSLYRGLISLNSSDTFYLEPLSDEASVRHSLRSTKHLPITGGSCAHPHHTSAFNLSSDWFPSHHSRVSSPDVPDLTSFSSQEQNIWEFWRVH